MCGFTGFIDFKRQWSREQLLDALAPMTNRLVHRGPDDCGLWAAENGGVALGFRRLAILDLSPHGAQPMNSCNERYTAVFNGEIYNFLDLRDELAALDYEFRGHSDTEVMLAGFVEWGIEATVKRLNGMFAIAVWDKERRELTLIRDRIGKKPLYYGVSNGHFIFGSELKALRAHPAFSAEIDRAALASYLRFGYVPSPSSIYERFFKLAPGKFLTVSADAGTVGEQTTYWSIEAVARDGLANIFEGSETEILSNFETLLCDAVKRRMIADVPLGAFLSGGIDSSIVVALMQAQSATPVKTFSIGFNDSEFNEARHAKAVAARLGTEHHELYVAPLEAQAVIPKLAQIYDEPFADSSQIPTVLVSALASQKVTVALSGDGGDEFFGGYSRYFTVSELWKNLKIIPASLRRPVARIISAGGAVAYALSPKNASRKSNLAEKIHRFSELAAVENLDSLYEDFVAHWQSPQKLILRNGQQSKTKIKDTTRFLNSIQEMMLKDAVRYLPDDILVKVDRASMSVSLEVRAPLLDYRIAEFAWRVPDKLKLRGGGKWLVKELLYKYVPREIVERPKMGFDVPIANWLRGPLRDWAEMLLDEKRLQRENFFDSSLIRRTWDEHLRGARNRQQPLWTILMFQAWLDEWKN